MLDFACELSFDFEKIGVNVGCVSLLDQEPNG